ncbi:hypothetical protein PVMG_05993 [Plasmodium vivax Mauritania I]|uniref:Uncharacterized protein n=1 Tax=Plasmodium vivax Mauritania I TaxID=1035515 RepID=A0A0J9VR48_PLAVI|nr:hypothetical protein PVMG_05993 [Plasmodium vivax Mauritania I]
MNYLNYGCYKHLSDRLDKPKLSDDKREYFESALKTIGEAKYNKFSQNEIIKNLAARLLNDGLFYFINPNIVCNYINYKLNESLRTHYDHIDREDYNIFKEFSKVFYYKRHKHDDAEKSCEKYIKHLDDDIYNRMILLYKIYYYYNELKSPYNFEYRNSKEKLCNNLTLLILNSNDAIKQNKINNESLSSIRNLKNIIEKDDESEEYKKKCDLDLLKGILTEHPKPKVQIPVEQAPALVPNAAPITQQSDKSEHEMKDPVNEQASSQLASEEETVRELASRGLPPQERAEWELTSHELEAKVQEPRIQVNRFQAEMHPGIIKQLSNVPEVTGQLEGRYILQEQRAPTDGTEGLLGKMQGFFTETLGQVEPAPILGVSGGMGALFLLFRVLKILKIYAYVYNTFK